MPRYDHEDDPGPDRCWCTGKPRFLWGCETCARRFLAELEGQRRAHQEREREETARHRAILFGSEE